jgi:hypothetical protein
MVIVQRNSNPQTEVVVRRPEQNMANTAKSEYLSVGEAIREAGVFSQQIYLAISSRKLEATRENGRWRLSRSSFNTWRKRLEARRELAATELETAHVTT